MLRHGLSFMAGMLALTSSAGAQKLGKAYQALQRYDYSQARVLLEAGLKTEPAAARYGLALLYGNPRSPLYRPDTAAVLMSQARGALKADPAQVRSLAALGITVLAVDSFYEQLSVGAFQRLQGQASAAEWEAYLKQFPDGPRAAAAATARDAAAYQHALAQQNPAALEDFINRYPESRQTGAARQQLEELRFTQITASGSASSYAAFITAHPQSPLRLRAEDSLYTLTQRQGTRAALEQFVAQHPDNPFIDRAWRSLYAYYTYSGDAWAFLAFLAAHGRECPFSEEVRADAARAFRVLLPVAQEGRWGYVDTTGQWQIPPQYDWADVFQEGLAVVEVQNQLGYLDKAGNLRWPLELTVAERMQAGKALAEKNGLLGWLTPQGTWALEPVYDDLAEVREGRVLMRKQGLYGYLNAEGEVAIAPQFTEAAAFHQGLAWARDAQSGRVGYLDSRGQWVVAPVFKAALPYAAGVLVAQDSTGWGAVTLTGDTLVPFMHTEVGPPQHSRMLVRSATRYGYLPLRREPLPALPYTYTEALAGRLGWHDGLALAQTPAGRGMIDTTGAWVLPPQYQDLGVPSQGRIPIKKGGKWGYADFRGQVVVPPAYELAEAFREGLARVKLGGRFGFIDTLGRVVVQPQYEAAYDFSHGWARVRQAGKWGVLLPDGALAYPCLLDDARLLQPGLVYVQRGTALALLHLASRRLLFTPADWPE